MSSAHPTSPLASPLAGRRATRRAARRSTVALLLVGASVLGLLSAAPLTEEAGASTAAATVPFQLVEDRPVDQRLPQPEDRYAMAGGCYTLQAADGTWLSRDASAVTFAAEAAAATPLHLQATRLGRYLLATNEGPDTAYDGAWWDVRGYVTAADALTGALAGVGAGSRATIAEAPSEQGDWEVLAVGDDPERRAPQGQRYLVRLPAAGPVAPGAELGEFTFHHVRDDDPSDDDPNGAACADWPEVDVDAEGRPAANPAGPAAEVQGFFESHVHGMAFEFLGGEARCGRPWHPYGVEHALVDCEDHEPGGHGAALEVLVSGGDPIEGHDTVGWPTFGYWPRHDSLTHEQYYWRWLERAYLGGLRLSVNLFVDNTALCQLYPHKRNSCNEMDGVRLQARRLFELQDYIDAQSGGPGEGWLRIVTDPTQARQVINAGRLAVVMGIEVSVLFDCGEYLDVPQCTTDQIDARLQEVFDMGVRQMELINKFDNALSGVTGDGGATGAVVNIGNRHVTGHFWDMQTCAEEDHAHEHDKLQPNVFDDAPGDAPDEVDVLAGAIIQAFGPTRGAVAPAYPEGPHCNTRGLTDLGRHLIEQMIERGMIVDPDHMSAAGMREALDHIEDVVIPAERAAAAAEHRPAVQPAVISSHSWGNDTIYQRIYQLDGVIGPRTASADAFVDRWVQRKDWAAELAPGSLFGIGYGADTNGLGGQPGPRRGAAVPLDYDGGFEAPIGGVRLFQHTSGLRTYDVGTDGVAHYGLFADWFREVALAAEEEYPHRGGAAEVTADMLAGSEAYLRLWERAVFGGGECVADQSAPHVEDIHALLGGNVEGFLEAVGQPASRQGAAYTYCAVGLDGMPVVVDVGFDEDGTARSVTPAADAAAAELLGPLPEVSLVHDH
jgi:hypothetical protein